MEMKMKFLRCRQPLQLAECASKLPDTAVIRNFIEFSRREGILGSFRKIAKSDR
jgi:hypothetical protein